MDSELEPLGWVIDEVACAAMLGECDVLELCGWLWKVESGKAYIYIEVLDRNYLQSCYFYVLDER